MFVSMMNQKSELFSCGWGAVFCFLMPIFVIKKRKAILKHFSLPGEGSYNFILHESLKYSSCPRVSHANCEFRKMGLV